VGKTVFSSLKEGAMGKVYLPVCYKAGNGRAKAWPFNMD